MYSMLPIAIACALHGLAFRRAGLTLTLTNAGMMTNASFPTEGKGDSTMRSISHGGRGGEKRATDSQREKHAIGPPARALKRSTAVALRSCGSPRKADPCVPKCKTICPIQLATSNLLAAGDMQTHLMTHLALRKRGRRERDKEDTGRGGGERRRRSKRK